MSTLKSLHMSTFHRVTQPPRLYTWGHMSTVSVVNPSKNLPWGTSTVSWVTPLPRPCTWDQTSSLQFDPLPHTLHLGSHIQNLEGDPPSRSCTCSHMSMVSMVKPS